MKPCIEFQGRRNDDGYGEVRIAGKTRKAHRAAFLLAHPEHSWESIKTLCVCHACDNPPCIEPSHLFLGTKKDNRDDMISKGREVVLRGEEHGRAKLSSAQVQQIRLLYASGLFTQEKLARQFGVSQRRISMIVRFRSWTHLTKV